MAEKYEAWFQTVDTDGSGKLSYSELLDLLTSKGYTDQKVQNIFDKADSDKDGEISLQEYLELMGVAAPGMHGESALRMVCKSFDKDGDGMIDKKEMEAVFAELGRNMTSAEVERIMKMTDTDGDGSIDYNELCQNVFGQACD